MADKDYSTWSDEELVQQHEQLAAQVQSIRDEIRLVVDARRKLAARREPSDRPTQAVQPKAADARSKGG